VNCFQGVSGSVWRDMEAYKELIGKRPKTKIKSINIFIYRDRLYSHVFVPRVICEFMH